MDFKIVGPRILLDMEEAEDLDAKYAAEIPNAFTGGKGIFLARAATAKPRPTVGKVVAMGTDPLLTEWGIVPGMRISISHLAGDRQFVEGKEYRLIEINEVKMILPPKEVSGSADGGSSLTPLSEP